jgi:hypothetical protein
VPDSAFQQTGGLRISADEIDAFNELSDECGASKRSQIRDTYHKRTGKMPTDQERSLILNKLKVRLANPKNTITSQVLNHWKFNVP